MEVGPGQLVVELAGLAQGEVSIQEFSILVNLEVSIPANLEFLEVNTLASLEFLEVNILASLEFPEVNIPANLEFLVNNLEFLAFSLLLLQLLPLSSLRKV